MTEQEREMLEEKARTASERWKAALDRLGKLGEHLNFLGRNTPEKDRLLSRLFDDGSVELLNFHVSWGPDADKLTAEERAAVINRVLDSVGSGNATASRSFEEPEADPQEVSHFFK